MLPLRDELPTRRAPIVTWALIAINVVIFVFGALTTVQVAPNTSIPKNDLNVYEWGVYPCEVFDRCDNVALDIPVKADGKPLDSGDVDQRTGEITAENVKTVRVDVDEHPAWLTVLTSAFLHGGWLHLGGNMLFLWIFGNNVEDAMSRPLFLLFYLAAAAVAALAQSGAEMNAQVPQVGASGAIAGVIGAYLLLYPRARVLTWVTALLILFIHLPAWVVAGFWGISQFLPALDQMFQPGTGAGVAYIAHLAGFVFGVLVIKFIAERNPIYEQIYKR